MTDAVLRTAFLERFACLGEKCEDTCCRGWSMQLDPVTYQRYVTEAPELLEATDTDSESNRIMRRDPKTDYCVKFDNGLCGIQSKRGTNFLGDACHFYPRVTRRLGNKILMTATLSCPEIARLALKGEDVFMWKEGQVDRLPQTLKDYLPNGLSEEKAMDVHKIFIEAAGDESTSPERIMMRLFSVAHSMARLDVAAWPEAAAFYLKNADVRLSSPEPQPADSFHLVQALLGLQVAARKKPGERLRKTISDMAAALKIQVDEKTSLVTMTPESLPSLEKMQQQWNAGWVLAYAPTLRRWIQAQLSLMTFPFAGFGNTLEERSLLLALRFAMVRLALMCATMAHGKGLPENEVIRVVQSLSRFLDHLADPEFSLAICREAGWSREGRLRALVGDSIDYEMVRTA